MRKIILFELNEVPWFIMDDFVKKNPTSTFAELSNKSIQYETYSEDAGDLSPWITWPSVHRGVNNQKHGIYDFGQELAKVNKNYPPIWKTLADAGIKTGIFASLHTYPLPTNLKNYSFYVPDSFARDAHCFPDSINSFQEFNLYMSRSSARNVSSKIEWKSALDILKSRKKLGIQYSTLLQLSAQLFHEKVNATKKCRRRTYQSVLSFDIFLSELNKTHPDICTYFTNHVASAMHRYWAATYPSHYEKTQYDKEWVDIYKYEIEFAMKKADSMLKKIVRFMKKNPEYDLWVLSSMGQAAVDFVPLNTQVYLVNADAFMTTLGLVRENWTPLPCMLPQSNFKVDPYFVDVFREKLKQIKIDNSPLHFREEAGGFFSINFGHGNLKDEFVLLGGETIPFEMLGLKNVEIEDKSTSSAYHIPEGILLIYSPEKSNVTDNHKRSKISTLSIAPTLLANFGIEKPSYMEDKIPGFDFQ